MGTNFIKTLQEQPRLLWNLAQRRNFWIVLLIDMILIVAAHVLAYLVRFDWQISWWIAKISAYSAFSYSLQESLYFIFLGSIRGCGDIQVLLI